MKNGIRNKKIRILFVCTHNSARSQMAEAFLNRLGGDTFEAESAGMERGQINPLVVEAMREKDIDISMARTKDVFDFYKQGRRYEYVIAVCDEASTQGCPIFPGYTTRLRWPFEDPARFTGTDEEKLARIRMVRDEIMRMVGEFVDVHKREERDDR